MIFHLFLTGLYDLLIRLTGHARTGTTRRPTRGANFIEYALLATVAVIIFLLLSTQMPEIINGVFENIRNAINI